MKPRLLTLLLLMLFGLALTMPQSAFAELGSIGSFSPIRMTGDNGKPLKLTWTYTVNEGQSLYFGQEYGDRYYSFKAKFGDLTLSIDPNTLKREVKLVAAISGSGTGQISMRVTEDLLPYTDGKTLITKQQLALNTKLSVQGVGASAVLKMQSQLSSPSEWFLDRNDLDTLGMGYMTQEAAVASITGSVCANIGGYRNCEDIEVNDSTSPEKWQIKSHSAQLSVKGTAYNNIVEVERNTVIPSFDSLTSFVEVYNDPVTIRYWVAKGIGMVKGYGQYKFLGEPLLIELKSTSIPWPKIAKAKRVVNKSITSLNITGKGFGKTVGKVKIAGQEVNVLSWANTVIRTELPVGLSAGSYTLQVQSANSIESPVSNVNLK